MRSLKSFLKIHKTFNGEKLSRLNHKLHKVQIFDSFAGFLLPEETVLFSVLLHFRFLSFGHDKGFCMILWRHELDHVVCVHLHHYFHLEFVFLRNNNNLFFIIGRGMRFLTI